MITPPVDSSGGIGRLVGYELCEASIDPLIELGLLDSRGRRGPVYSLARLPYAMFLVWRDCRRRRHDVIHVNVSVGASTVRKLVLTWVAHKAGTPVILHLHGSGYDEFYERLPNVGQRWVRAGFRQAHSVVVLGEVWRNFVRERLGVPADEIFVIPNAVPGPRDSGDGVREDTGILRIAFLGEYGDRKGSALLIAAVAQLVADGVQVQLELAGSGPLASAQEVADQLGVSDCTTFHSWVSQQSVADILQRSDVLCLPSAAENLPLVVLEAMAHGCVVVATDVGAVREAVTDGVTGRLVTHRSPQAIAEALRSLVDPNVRQAMAAAGVAEWRARFTPPQHWARLRRVWMAASRTRDH